MICSSKFDFITIPQALKMNTEYMNFVRTCSFLLSRVGRTFPCKTFHCACINYLCLVSLENTLIYQQLILLNAPGRTRTCNACPAGYRKSVTSVSTGEGGAAIVLTDITLPNINGSAFGTYVTIFNAEIF
jgi:hypothetical protein